MNRKISRKLKKVLDSCAMPASQGRRSGYESGEGDGIHVNPERSFGGKNGEPPSEASQLRKGGPGVLPREISKTYMANGAIYVIPELYL